MRRSGPDNRDRFGECFTAAGVRVVAVPAGVGAEAVGDVEGGLVLGEASGGVVPCSGGWPGSGSVAEAFGDVGRLVEAGDSGSRAQVDGELVIDGFEFVFELWLLGEHGSCTCFRCVSPEVPRVWCSAGLWVSGRVGKILLTVPEGFVLGEWDVADL